MVLLRRMKEGTSAVLLQSGLHEKWWADSMECYWRNVQDLLADGTELLKQIWTCCKKIGLMIVGMWTRFTKFTAMKKKPPKGYLWSGERQTQIQATTRPDNLWPEVWSHLGEAARKKEMQEWANEKPKLDNARKQRGI